MMKDKLLKALKDNTFCRLQPSSVHGVGVFTIKDIPSGVNPFEDAHFDGEFIVPHEELEILDEEVKALVYSYYMFDKEGVWFQVVGGNPVSPNLAPIFYRINHSKEPNVSWSEDCYCFRTIKAVKKGGELFFDYGEHYRKNF